MPAAAEASDLLVLQQASLTRRAPDGLLAPQANWLRSVGVQQGDAVAIYLPMRCELPIAMLACARIGAVHSVIFGGFSSGAPHWQALRSCSRGGHWGVLREPCA